MESMKRLSTAETQSREYTQSAPALNLTERELEIRAAIRYQENLKLSQEGYRRSRKERWSFPIKVRVRHPLIGEVIVPGASRYAAILCACEKCRRKYTELHDAEVRTV